MEGVGHVPKDHIAPTSKRYNDALDRLYGGLNASRQEKEMSHYKIASNLLKRKGELPASSAKRAFYKIK